MPFLRDAAEQDCENCNGNRQLCKKLSASITDGKLIITETKCDKAEAYTIRKRATKLITAAGVPKIFANFRAADYRSTNEPALDAAEAAIFDDKSAYIFGAVGTGKTLLAAIVANERAYLGKPSLFISVAETLETLREFNNQTQRFTDSRTREDKLRLYAASPCLIVDDLGAEKPTEWAIETLFKIFNRRYNDGLPSVTTSNLAPAELERHLGARIARRILHNAAIVELK